MKIRIVEPGWSSYTGLFGAVEFVNGESVEDVARADAQHLAGLVAIETLEGKNPSASQAIIDSNGFSAPVEAVVEVPAPAPAPQYSADDLAAIADKSGIKGLREIAEPMGLKANSISELIEKILAFQAAKAAEEAKAAAPKE